MWGYYGSKSKIVNKYPAPKYDVIIEPFAGTAQYSLKYFEKDILLIEKYDVIVNLWRWLQQCSPGDILSLPRLKEGENVDDFHFDCLEAKHLVGFIIAGAPSQPKKTASKWKATIRPNTQNYKLNLVANSLYKIKHWNILLGDYTLAENKPAAWFIDPPYEFGGQYYRHGNKNIDYSILRKWIEERNGQVIACENSKATWMNFKPLSEMNGNKFRTMECMWYKPV